MESMIFYATSTGTPYLPDQCPRREVCFVPSLGAVIDPGSLLARLSQPRLLQGEYSVQLYTTIG